MRESPMVPPVIERFRVIGREQWKDGAHGFVEIRWK